MKASFSSILVPLVAIFCSCEAFIATSTIVDLKPKPNTMQPTYTSCPVLKQRSVESTLKLFYQDDDSREESIERRRELERKINNFLRASQRSFQNVESITNRLLNHQPLLALALFVTAGALVAYLLGLVFLGGYIETWNPVDNDTIPYWDEEILIISRKVGK